MKRIDLDHPPARPNRGLNAVARCNILMLKQPSACRARIVIMFLDNARTIDLPAEISDGDALLCRKLDSYRVLGMEDRQRLQRALDQRRRHTEPRSVLIEQGEPPREICVMLEGWAARQKVLADGKRQILAFHLPGDICEFNALLGAVTDTETVALSPVLSASITGRTLSELTATAPRVGQALWWDAFASGAVQREWMINVIRRPALQRLAHLLCELHTRLGLVGLATKDACVTPLTQAHLANACGMTVEHTNRTIRKLRDEHGILFEAGSIALGDVAKARELATFEEKYILLHETDRHADWHAGPF